MKKIIAACLSTLLLIGCAPEAAAPAEVLQTEPVQLAVNPEETVPTVPEEAPLPEKTAPAVPEEEAPGAQTEETTPAHRSQPDAPQKVQSKPEEAPKPTQPAESKPEEPQKEVHKEEPKKEEPKQEEEKPSEPEVPTQTQKPGNEKPFGLGSCWARLMLGQTYQMDYSGSGTYQWTSSDPAVATVSDTGLVTAVAPGSVTISVTDGVQTFSCPVEITATDNVVVILENKPVFMGEPRKIEYEYSGSDLRTLTWRSEDTSVLTVDQNGVVTGVAPGKAKVTVTDGDVRDTRTVEIRAQEDKTTGILISRDNASLENGSIHFAGDYMRFAVEAKPDYNIDINVSSSNSSVVGVKLVTDPQYTSPYYHMYKLTFKKAGKATITLYSEDGCVSESYTIYVKANYDCDPGKTSLTPEEFARCATLVGVENGQGESRRLSGYRYHYVAEKDLTWENARGVGESLAHEWYSIGISGMLVTYEGWSEEQGKHLFYIGY